MKKVIFSLAVLIILSSCTRENVVQSVDSISAEAESRIMHI